MTRTLTLPYLGVIYKIKIRTIPNSDHSSIVVWRNETALTGTSFVGVLGNKKAKIMAELMIDEYYMSMWKSIKQQGLEKEFYPKLPLQTKNIR